MKNNLRTFMNLYKQRVLSQTKKEKEDRIHGFTKKKKIKTINEALSKAFKPFSSTLEVYKE